MPVSELHYNQLFPKARKMKIALKIKVFLWLMIKERILTKDNLSKKGWIGTKNYEFLGADESVGHLPLCVFVCLFPF